MKHMVLTRGLVAIVDDADFEWLSQWKWCAISVARTHYAQRRQCMPGGKSIAFLMHRVILQTPVGMVTDHRDCNGLNNTRANLRAVTQQQNLMNRRPQLGGTSPLKGVWWDNAVPRTPWRSAIRLNGKLQYLGRHETAEEGAAAYAAAAAKYFGEFHRTTDGAPT